MSNLADLIEQRQKLKAYLDGEQERFNEFCKPYREKMEQLDAQCSAMMLEQGIKSLRTDHGTGILSEITSAKIKADERDAYLDMCLEQWDAFGAEMLQIGPPKAEAIRNYMDTHEGHIPPHIEMSTVLRFSVRKV